MRNHLLVLSALAIGVLLPLLACVKPDGGRPDAADEAVRADSVHREAFVADMHCDTIGRVLEGEDLRLDLDRGHVDLPKLKRGGVDLQVFACFVGAPRDDDDRLKAAERALDQVEAVKKLAADNPRELALILEPEDIPRLTAESKTGAIIGIEGGYAIQNDLDVLRSFYRSGVRLMTLTHWTRTDWADASGDDAPRFGGLTDFGRRVVEEMNRLGMIIDLSHSGDTTFWEVVKISRAPAVASHSCCRALADHHRNLTDDMLRALAGTGGVVGINFNPGFLNAEIIRKEEELYREVARKHGIPEGQMDWRRIDPGVREAAEAEVKERLTELRKALPVVDIKTLADHIEHAVRVTGSVDFVGLGSDYDGISTTPAGLENCGLLPNITRELLRRGFKDEEIHKILGGNFVRVFKAVAEARQQ